MPAPVRWDVDRAAQLYRDGWSLKQIGAELGVAPTTVATQLRKTLQMRPASRPPTSTPAAKPVPIAWRRLFLDALDDQATIEVAAVVEKHLGRRPTKSEATAARRAANTLAAAGLAVRSYIRLESRSRLGPRDHLVLARP